jgi:hypothetical protein
MFRLSYGLYDISAKCLYLTQKFDRAAVVFAEVLQHTSTLEQRVRALRGQSALLVNASRLTEALDSLFECCNLLSESVTRRLRSSMGAVEPVVPTYVCETVFGMVVFGLAGAGGVSSSFLLLFFFFSSSSSCSFVSACLPRSLFAVVFIVHYLCSCLWLFPLTFVASSICALSFLSV